MPLIVLLLLFLLSAHLSQTYHEELSRWVSGSGWWGVLIYASVAAFTTVVAPLSSVPLMPLAASLWGPLVTALASIVGWQIGAMVSFYLSRRYGRKLVEAFVSKEKLAALEKRIPQKNLFWSIVLLRMAVPVDMLSYLLGLFKNLSWKVYGFATLIGITPFAFVFAYAGSLPLKFQLILVPVVAVLLILVQRGAKV